MSKPPASIHDAFFKQVIGDPAMADRFLREHLPPAVVALLGPEPPELLPGSFVDEELGQHHSDLLFKVRLRNGGEALIHLVVEHKSAPDPLARLQLLRYEIRILVRLVRERQRAKQPVLPLPPVVPLLVHHSPEGWTASTEFADLFGPVPEVLRPFLPSFRHALVDLIHIPDAALSADVRLRVRLKALKYALHPDLARFLDIILAEAAELEEVDLTVVLTYIALAPARVTEEEIRMALHRVVPFPEEAIAGSWLQKYVDKGRAEGEAKGKAEMLIEMFELRFGPLSPENQDRVRGADSAQLHEWSRRFVNARTLADVFEPKTEH